MHYVRSFYNLICLLLFVLGIVRFISLNENMGYDQLLHHLSNLISFIFNEFFDDVLILIYFYTQRASLSVHGSASTFLHYPLANE